MTRRVAGRRPAPRTVEVTGLGEYETWRAKARADFPARLLDPMETGKLGPIMDALDKIILEHNFPDTDGSIADSLSDVDPYDGVVHMAGQITEAITRLPPR